MAWGVFEMRDDNEKLKEIHIAQIDDDDLILGYHILDETCPCQPQIDEENGVTFYIHSGVQ